MLFAVFLGMVIGFMMAVIVELCKWYSFKQKTGSWIAKGSNYKESKTFITSLILLYMPSRLKM